MSMQIASYREKQATLTESLQAIKSRKAGAGKLSVNVSTCLLPIIVTVV